jgi:hypothetical protein
VPQGLSAKDRPGGRTQVLNVRRIQPNDRHPAESDEDSSPESITHSKNWLNWNGDLANQNPSKDDWEVDNESDIELDNSSEVSETLEVRNVSGAPNVPGLIRHIRQATKKVETGLVTVVLMETRRTKGIKKK